ncbi:MAG: AraC family transcriptional regulator [Myxococcales bacterium]|nr:AraC family transcriptional regulator [Myxococcales bacterium]
MTWIRAAATRAIVAAARSRGVEPAALLRSAKVGELPDDAWSTVPLTLHFAVLETGVRLLDDPGFIVDVARHVPVETYDVMGFAMRSAPDLAGAVEVARRYQPLYTSSSTFDVDRSRSGLRVWLRPSGPLPLAARCATESAVAQMVEIARQLAGRALSPLRVAFRHPAPKKTRAHEAFFGAPIEWEAPLAEIVFDAEAAGTRVVSADPRLHAFLVKTAEAALAEHRPPATLVDQARRVAAELLPSGKLSIESMAARLGTTDRTLRRRLAEQGTSFLEIRDAVRLDLAKQYLAERSLPLGEVAFLLDFADERAFRRSFQRWTGESPARYRAAR